jgi:hypothetical protein
MHSAHKLAGLADELAAANIRIRAVEAHSSVRERLRSQGVDAKLGTVTRFTSVADMVEDSQKELRRENAPKDPPAAGDTYEQE